MHILDIASLLRQRDDAILQIGVNREDTDLLWGLHYDADDRLRKALGAKPAPKGSGRRPPFLRFGCVDVYIDDIYGPMHVVEREPAFTKQQQQQVAKAHAALTILALARLHNIARRARSV